MKSLLPKLLIEQPFILTYKMSQDHLELFFNAVRRAGGWNNNPNVPQFEAIFRKLCMHCDIKTSTVGNVTAQDETSCITLLTPVCRTGTITDDTFEEVASILDEHNYTGWAPRTANSVVLSNILAYVAGWVVKKVMRSITCDICRVSLISQEIPRSFDRSYHLLKLKNNGGLVIPSRGVIVIIENAEKAIRQLSMNPMRNCKFQNILIFVKKMIRNEDLLGLDQHATESQHEIDNHFFDLLRSIVKAYYDLRHHHIAKMYTVQKLGLSIRHQVNKTVLFKGQ
jgi:hypothetical protein